MDDERRVEGGSVEGGSVGGGSAPPTAPVAVAPPTRPGEIRRVGRRSAWPTVFGVISIVLGGGGVLGGIGGIVSTVFLGAMTAAMMGASAGTIRVVNVLSSAVALVVASVLLAGGIGLTMRRRWGARTVLAWAVVKMVVTVPAVAAGAWVQHLSFQHSMQQAASQSPGAALPPGVGVAMAAVTVVFGLAWGWAWPVLCLVWLGRTRCRAEWSTWR